MDGMEKLSRRFRTLLRPRLRLARPGFYFLVVLYYEELFLKLYCLHGISPGGGFVYPAVHRPHRHGPGAVVRRSVPREGQGAAGAVYRADLSVAGGPGGVLPPIQDLSHHLLPDQDGHGGRGLWRHGHHRDHSELVPHSDDGTAGDLRRCGAEEDRPGPARPGWAAHPVGRGGHSGAAGR